MKAFSIFVKLIPYLIIALGIAGASINPTWSAGAVCCGVITILAVFYMAVKDVK